MNRTNQISKPVKHARRTYVTLERLMAMTAEELKAEWSRRYAGPAPNLSPDLLQLGLAYRLQEQKSGAISRSTRSLLREVAARTTKGKGTKAMPRKLMPGTRIMRDWHGTGHTVTVLDSGFEYDGKKWNSLSAIAKAITGTHWNGPRFFGLNGYGA